MNLNSSKYNILLITFLMLFFVACQKGGEPVPFSYENNGDSEQVFSSQRVGDVPSEKDSTGIKGTNGSGGTEGTINDGKVIGGDDNEDDDDLDNGIGTAGAGIGIGIGKSNSGGGV